MKKRTVISILMFSALIVSWSCATYSLIINPAVGYDVLNPPEKVKINPLRITDDGNFVVNPEFIYWVRDLELEVHWLRKRGK